MKYVIIVNGKPGSGKTTFENMCRSYSDIKDLAYCHIISSISPIKDIYKQLGWNGKKKTEETRKHLSTLKQMWIDLCDGPITYILKSVLALDDDSDHIVFVDIREESEIIKLTETLDVLDVLNIRYTTVFIARLDADDVEYGNKSDDNIGQNMSLYEYIIHNDDSTGELDACARKFIDTINIKMEE